MKKFAVVAVAALLVVACGKKEEAPAVEAVAPAVEAAPAPVAEAPAADAAAAPAAEEAAPAQ